MKLSYGSEFTYKKRHHLRISRTKLKKKTAKKKKGHEKFFFLM